MFLFSQAVKLAGKHLHWHIFQRSAQLLPVGSPDSCELLFSEMLVKKVKKRHFSTQEPLIGVKMSPGGRKEENTSYR